MLRIRHDMPNHLHLIPTPTTLEGLSRAVGEAHRRYTAFVNARARVTGHLFELRGHDTHCAIRPCAKPREWEWSSVRAHLRGRDDALVAVRPLLAIAPRFGELLEMSPSEKAELVGFESLGANGRPLGEAAFLAAAEHRLGRSLRKKRPGPKPRAAR
jgi:putative transposase